jgi:ABC transporter substrate binding protein
VLALVGDADGLGLIESLAHPGGNVTGVTDQSVELSAKRMEILKEAVPKASRVAVLWNADDRGMTMRFREVEKAAQRLHVSVQPLGVREPDDFDTAFSAMTQNRPDALFLVTDALTLLNRKRQPEDREGARPGGHGRRGAAYCRSLLEALSAAGAPKWPPHSPRPQTVVAVPHTRRRGGAAREAERRLL